MPIAVLRRPRAADIGTHGVASYLSDLYMFCRNSQFKKRDICHCYSQGVMYKLPFDYRRDESCLKAGRVSAIRYSQFTTIT